MTVTAQVARPPRYGLYWRFNRFLERHLPAGLYQRSLIIVIAPLVISQTIMAGVVLERHWDNVTKVLARSLAREVALMIDLYDKSPKDDAARHRETAASAGETARLSRLPCRFADSRG